HRRRNRLCNSDLGKTFHCLHAAEPSTYHARVLFCFGGACWCNFVDSCGDSSAATSFLDARDCGRNCIVGDLPVWSISCAMGVPAGQSCIALGRGTDSCARGNLSSRSTYTSNGSAW